jgi:hypothetical protein
MEKNQENLNKSGTWAKKSKLKLNAIRLFIAIFKVTQLVATISAKVTQLTATQVAVTTPAILVKVCIPAWRRIVGKVRRPKPPSFVSAQL